MKGHKINIDKYLQNELTDSEIMDWFDSHDISEQEEIIDNLSVRVQQAHPKEEFVYKAIKKTEKHSDLELRKTFISMLSILKTSKTYKRGSGCKRGCLEILLSIALVILILFLVSRISISRSDEKLEKIAKVIFKNRQHDFIETDKWDDFILIPYESNESGDGLIFTWYYVLDFGDTATVNIELLRSKRLLHDENPKITGNRKVSYIFNSEKDLSNLLPQKYKQNFNYITNLTLSSDQEFMVDSSDKYTLIIESNRLYDFLERGYYNVLARYDNYTSVAFYEPIANLRTDSKETSTLTAKIIFKENSEVLILPYRANDIEWSNYNKE